MIDYKPIFNKMTIPVFDKFNSINDLKIPRGKNKEEYEEKLIETFENDESIETLFQEYYKKLEEAGRKHIYIFKLNPKEIKIDDVRENFKKFTKEDDRSFNPEQDNNKVFVKEENNLLTAKKIQINRIFLHLDQDTEEDDILTKKYQIINVHYIKFITFDFNLNRIICGYDSCGDLLQKKLHEKEFKEFIEMFISNSLKLESYLTSEHVEKLRFLQNCLSYSINSKANSFDTANFRKSKANFDKILKDLKNQKYTLDNIKENNPDFDIQSNILFNAGITASMDNDFTLTNEGFEFYYFSEKSGKPDYFRLKLDVSDGSITTFSESITKGELWDVLRYIN